MPLVHGNPLDPKIRVERVFIIIYFFFFSEIKLKSDIELNYNKNIYGSYVPFGGIV